MSGSILTYGAHATLEIELGAHAPKPTAVTEGLTEAGLPVWSGGPNHRIETGLWECSAGDFTAERVGYTEICTILAGRVTVEVAGAEPQDFGPGDVMVMPSGWVGTWRVHEPLRKHFTTIQDS